LKNTIFGAAFVQLQQYDPKKILKTNPINLELVGDDVHGPGVRRQFFSDISRELRSVLPLLIPCPNAQENSGENRDKYIINPACKSETFLKMYRFLGQLIGWIINIGTFLSNVSNS
jgi:E3 ubiquitin-protein ligase HERC2